MKSAGWQKLVYRVACALVWLQNWILIGIGRLLFRTVAGAPESILVLRPSAIGDFVCALPALHVLRKRFPQSRITLLTTPTANPKYWDVVREAGGSELASPSLVDTTISFYAWGLRQPAHWQELRCVIGQLNPDLTYVLPFSGEPFSNRLKKLLFLRVLGVRRNVYGYRMCNTLGFLRTAQFRQAGYPHQVTAALEAVNQGPGTNHDSEIVFSLDRHEDDRRVIDRLWAEHGLPGQGPIIALSPGGRFAHKRWPLENFCVLCEALVRELDARIVVIGGREDRAVGEALQASDRERIHNFAGWASLRQTVEILRRCHLYVGNDSGPAHLAGAVGVPCVTIFSGVTFPGLWEPWGRRNVALRHSVACEYCFSEGHCPRATMACIKGITTAEVLAACCEQLENVPLAVKPQVMLQAGKAAQA
ncbi:MAG: glycosyltransferase family 9 protein [Acidobacteria bacterium]|nr:glycosyltransferase family 9 protein [Acidobacteriota bacterium]